MDVLYQIASGFVVAAQPENLLFLFIGTLLGTLVGMLPGLGPVSGISLLIPLTFGLNPISALIMFAGMYYGAAYGNTISAVLINTPGTASSVMTAVDGYPMAQKGRAGAALLIAAIASFASGTISVVALTLLALPLAAVALRFGPAEYFALMFFAITSVAVLSGRSWAKGVLAALLGLLVTTIGIDLQSGQPRFTMGIPNFLDGISFLVQVVGLFAVAEVLVNIERMASGRQTSVRLEGPLWCTREELKRSVKPIMRGGVIGFLVGILPGAGQTIATILAYAMEKRISKTPEEFGKGAVEGVAAPESANNAATSGSFVPLLTLGVPGSATTAVLLGAFILYGIQPGPQLFQNQPELAWGLINSMYIGNIMLLILNVPLVGLFARLIYLPQGMLMALVLTIASVSIYAINGSVFDLYMLLFFGVVGYGFRKLDIPIAPYVLAVVLGGMLEQSFRQAMTLSGGNPSIFFASAVCVILWIMSAASIGSNFIKRGSPASGKAAP
jgi:putative tricarboxylic transport membrane protein